MERRKYLGNFFRGFVLTVFIFSASLIYLHQKVLYFVEAYQLSRNYRLFNSLVDKKDSLMYNLAQETSLAKIHRWAENNNFSFAKVDKVITLDLRKSEPPALAAKLAFLFNRLTGLSALPPQALAETEK